MTETKEQYDTKSLVNAVGAELGLPPLYPGEGVTVEPSSIQAVGDDLVTVRLKVLELTSEWEIKRQVPGANIKRPGMSDFVPINTDGARGYWKLAPINLEIAVNVDHAQALRETGGDLAILGEVFRQTSWALQTQVNVNMADHFKTLEAVKATELKITPRPTVELREVKAETTEQI